LLALAAGIVVALAGKLHPGLAFLFNGSWFSAAVVAFVSYYILAGKKK
jgi:NCS1 family nucleobase:cation symporter-1